MAKCLSTCRAQCQPLLAGHHTVATLSCGGLWSCPNWPCPVPHQQVLSTRIPHLHLWSSASNSLSSCNHASYILDNFLQALRCSQAPSPVADHSGANCTGPDSRCQVCSRVRRLSEVQFVNFANWVRTWTKPEVRSSGSAKSQKVLNLNLNLGELVMMQPKNLQNYLWFCGNLQKVHLN
jgi:hypothetical protein